MPTDPLNLLSIASCVIIQVLLMDGGSCITISKANTSRHLDRQVLLPHIPGTLRQLATGLSFSTLAQS